MYPNPFTQLHYAPQEVIDLNQKLLVERLKGYAARTLPATELELLDRALVGVIAERAKVDYYHIPELKELATTAIAAALLVPDIQAQISARAQAEVQRAVASKDRHGGIQHAIHAAMHQLITKNIHTAVEDAFLLRQAEIGKLIQHEIAAHVAHESKAAKKKAAARKALKKKPSPRR